MTKQRMLELQWWGSERPYGPALQRQLAHRERVLAGGAGDLLALIEHRSVITTGRRKVERLPSPQWLEQNQTELVRTARGGLATWHGPGQLTGYLIMDLRRIGVRRTVRALEQGLMQWLRRRGQIVSLRAEHPGVWCAQGKLAAIGLHVSRGVSVHGFALNLRVQTLAWQQIVPCGIHDAGPCSLDQLQSNAPSPEMAWREVGESVRDSLLSLDAACAPR